MASLAKAFLVLLAAIGAVAIICTAWIAVDGISAQPDPPRFEKILARTLRHRLIPATERAKVNPVAATSEVIESALHHWADHCASCHGNDGKGVTALGTGLYPRSPDMTLPATQELSDGELYWIIENGIRLTGMPAWGDGSPEESRESWELVHFIRHLPDLSDTELRAMERLNPLSRKELEQLLEIERFLAGEISTPPKPVSEDHHH